MARKGMMVGSGKRGYHNIIGRDPSVHAQSARGMKQPQNINIFTPTELPIYKIGGKFYFRDTRLGEYRNIIDPSDRKDINISNELLEMPAKDDWEKIDYLRKWSLKNLRENTEDWLAKMGKEVYGAEPSIYTVNGKADYVGTEVEDENNRWDDSYLIKNGYWVIHDGKKHHVYKTNPDDENNQIALKEFGKPYANLTKDQKWEFEQLIEYEKSKEKLVGGLGDNKPDSAFNKKELAKGINVEMEHTNNPEIAKEVVKDHLTEFPKGYYSNLDKMEKKLKREKIIGQENTKQNRENRFYNIDEKFIKKKLKEENKSKKVNTNYEELDKEQRKVIENIDKEKYGQYKIGDLRQIMSKYQNKENWKKPFTAKVSTREEAEKLATAIRFFMADEPRVELNNIFSPAEIKKGNFYRKTPSYSVTTRGYQAW
jgi:hypothetical protein